MVLFAPCLVASSIASLTAKAWPEWSQRVRQHRQDYAATLYDHQGEAPIAKQLRDAANRLTQPAAKEASSNGMGSQFLGAAGAVLQLLGPLAVKALLPIGL
jgi:hypothetical protein